MAHVYLCVRGVICARKRDAQYLKETRKKKMRKSQKVSGVESSQIFEIQSLKTTNLLFNSKWILHNSLKMNLFSLTKAIYLKQKVPSTNLNLLSTAQRISHKLPKDIEFGEGRQQFERAFNEHTSTKSDHNQYTDFELQTALKDNVLNGLTYKHCKEKYGIPEATMKRHISTLAKQFGCSTRKEIMEYRSQSTEQEVNVRQAIMCFVVPKKGPSSYLSQTEVDLILVIADKKNSAGTNQAKPTIGQECRELCRAKALEMPEGPEKERFEKAVCDASFVRKVVQRFSIKADDLNPRFLRNSPISSKRAEASNPMLQCIMEAKIEDWFDDLRSQGIYIPPEGPPARVLWNGDEKGFSTNAKFPPSFTLDGTMRRFTIVSGEKSKFWTTMFYWINGAGDVPIAPTIVHQGGSDTEIPAKFMHGLTDDWRVHNTASGYMDKRGFYHCIESLVNYIRERDGNNDEHQFVFLDGHDSHWLADALKLAKENNIHVFFLKSNDSINDQPADMGANAKLEKYYQSSMAAWRRKYVSTPFTPMFMNEVLVTAFKEFLQDKEVILHPTTCVYNAQTS